MAAGNATPIRRLPGILLGTALFLIIIGLKWAAFGRFGSAMPDWDQWDAEAVKLLIPWFEGDHFLVRLFEPHNEHRVVLTKLQSLLLTLLNGQWDSRVLTTVNALLHAGMAVGLWALGRRWVQGGAQVALFILPVILFGAPLAWQNVLGGFHSQQYWLLGLSAVAIVLLPFAAPGRPAWWLGLAAAGAALLSMGSGFLAAAVVLLVLGWRTWRGEAPLRSWWPTSLILTAWVAAGLLTRVEVAYHAQLKAATVQDFTFSLLRSLAWPLRGQDWAGAVLWLPWLLVVLRMLRAPAGCVREERAGLTIAALGGWVIAQLLATAYVRGAGADYPASRYMDTLTFGAMVNGLALGWLGWPATHAGHGWSRRAAAGLAALWLAVFTWGWVELLHRNLTDEMAGARRYYDKAERHLLGYLATGDIRQLVPPDIPYPSPDGLAERLSHAPLRRLMPAEVRPSLPLEADGGSPFAGGLASALDPTRPAHTGLSPSTPVLPSRPTWGSFGADGAAARGTWRSRPVAPGEHAWLKFETAGTLGRPGVSLQLRDAATGAALADVRPSRIPGDSWRAAYVRTPEAPYVVVATDDDAEGWLAFSAPVEMASLSLAAREATKHGFLVAELGALLALGVAAGGWWRRKMARGRAGAPDGWPNQSGRAALVAALITVIWAGKLLVVERSGTDLPYWDQWAKEGELLFAPWIERHELGANLLVPHNEHRIAPSLAMNLALLSAGGQWDARVQCLASGALHAFLLAGLFTWWSRRVPARLLPAGALLFAAVGAAPIVWENLVSGFQSSFYFLAGFSLLAAGGLLLRRPFSPGWWGGLMAGALALVSMGSGLLCAAPIAAVALLRLRDPGRRRDAAWTLAAALALGGAGALLHTSAPWHDSLHARTPGAFLAYFARCLAWPAPEWPWLAALLWAPWLVLLARRLRSRSAADAAPAVDFVLAGGLWVLAQAAAAAYSRAAVGGLPASRYGDLFALGLLFSFLALTIPPAPPRRRLATAVLALAGVTTLLARAGLATWQGPLEEKRVTHAAYERSVQAFVLTDDYAAFERAVLPFPSAEWLARILRQPSLRETLPASVRRPLAVPGLAGGEPPTRLPPLANRATRVVPGPGEWRSTQLAPDSGWWKIEMAGDTAEAGVSLALVSAASGRTLAAIRPTRTAGNSWRAAYVPAPREPAHLVARVTAPDCWMAFSEPVRRSTLSHAAWWLARQGGWLLALGLTGLLAASWRLTRTR